MERKHRRTHHCAVPNCPTNRNPFFNKSFFRFPREESLCKEWVAAIGRSDFTDKSAEFLYSAHRICSEHFEDKWFVNELKNRRHSQAVPSIFLTHGSHHGARQRRKRQADDGGPQPRQKKRKLALKAKDVNSVSTDEASGRGRVSSGMPVSAGGPCCAVPCCSNKMHVTRGSDKASHVLYHSFPRTAGLRRAWMKACGLGRLLGRSGHFVCSDHFPAADYVTSRSNGRRKLKQTAVPSQKLGGGTDNKRDVFRWPVIDKVYAQWKDHSTLVNETTVVIKQEAEEPVVNGTAQSTKPCVVNLSLNNVLTRRDSREVLELLTAGSLPVPAGPKRGRSEANTDPIVKLYRSVRLETAQGKERMSVDDVRSDAGEGATRGKPARSGRRDPGLGVTSANSTFKEKTKTYKRGKRRRVFTILKRIRSRISTTQEKSRSSVISSKPRFSTSVANQSRSRSRTVKPEEKYKPILEEPSKVCDKQSDCKETSFSVLDNVPCPTSDVGQTVPDVPDNMSSTTSVSSENSSQLVMGNVASPATDDDEDGHHVYLENVPSSTTDDVEKSMVASVFDKLENDQDTAPDSTESLVAADLPVAEMKQKRRGVSKTNPAAPVRRTERVPVKKKFPGDFEGPDSKMVRRRRGKTLSPERVDSPAPAVETPSTPPFRHASPERTTSCSPVTSSTVPGGVAPSTTSTPAKSPAAPESSPPPEELCFVCDKAARGGVSVHQRTATSAVCVCRRAARPRRSCASCATRRRGAACRCTSARPPAQCTSTRSWMPSWGWTG
ncbi:uncharacterized protein LOC134530052 isoform X2 [Bacillus rossius redtenbacheri]|uniref:uncharacterized protein LOC134530052 isoform X2 n=1 Tax=Bacillus rossius redtenbacheri TaxID=93214 RepID=UPI002FDEBAC1